MGFIITFEISVFIIILCHNFLSSLDRFVILRILNVDLHFSAVFELLSKEFFPFSSLFVELSCSFRDTFVTCIDHCCLLVLSI